MSAGRQVFLEPGTTFTTRRTDRLRLRAGYQNPALSWMDFEQPRAQFP
jgi:hypothetical protein